MPTGKPLTAEDYRALAAKNNYKWLSTEVINSRTKTLWRCSLGHEWLMPYSNLQQGQGCPTCARVYQFDNIRLTDADYESVAELHGIAWLGPSVPSVAEKSLWKCSEGHVWETTYTSIRTGRGCPYCGYEHRNDFHRKSEQDYHLVAEQRGIKFIGAFPKTGKVKTLWQCREGHEWLSSYHEIAAGHGCPYCAGVARKIPADYISLAKGRGLEIIGNPPVNTSAKATWKCPHGHEWQGTYHDVASGSGCPRCARLHVGELRRKSASDYYQIAQEHGFLWLGELPAYIHDVTEWQCSNGHRFNKSYTAIYNGTDCPLCSNYVNGSATSKPQLALHEMLGGTINHRVKNYAIDIALSVFGVKIAVEYDSWYWHRGRELHDAKRDRYLIKQGWRMLHVKSGSLLPSIEQLQSAIAELIAGSDTTEITLSDWRE